MDGDVVLVIFASLVPSTVSDTQWVLRDCGSF